MVGAAIQTDQGQLHVLMTGLCFMVLFLEGYAITAMSYAIRR